MFYVCVCVFEYKVAFCETFRKKSLQQFVQSNAQTVHRTFNQVLQYSSVSKVLSPRFCLQGSVDKVLVFDQSFFVCFCRSAAHPIRRCSHIIKIYSLL